MSGSVRFLPVCVCLLLCAGCRDRGAPEDVMPPPATPASTATIGAPTPPLASPTTVAPAPSAVGPDAWLGQWNGPEGTSLVLERKAGGGYRVTITNLDGPTRYDGDAAGPNIVFDRDGETQTIRAGNGKLTGMKWLSDKSDCLVIKVGEGYCRD